MPEVSCSVSNCEFWDKGNKCGADSILVEIDEHSNQNYDMEAGTMVDEDMHRDKGKSIADTCCHTFRPKNK